MIATTIILFESFEKKSNKLFEKFKNDMQTIHINKCVHIGTHTYTHSHIIVIE